MKKYRLVLAGLMLIFSFTTVHAEVIGNPILSSQDSDNLIYYFKNNPTHIQPGPGVDLTANNGAGEAHVVGKDEQLLNRSIQETEPTLKAMTTACELKKEPKLILDVSLVKFQQGGYWYSAASQFLSGMITACTNPPSPMAKAFMQKLDTIHIKLGRECHVLKNHPANGPFDHAEFDAASKTLTIYDAGIGPCGNGYDTGMALWIQDQ
jgi:hypothetical protein